MNLYGDRGNILTLVKRCLWRNIEVEIKEFSLGNKTDFSEADIVFMGGGQDKEQEIVAEDLKNIKGSYLKQEVERGLVCLTICGAYQLFGKYFKTHDQKELPGIDIFDAYTEAGDKRLIGNVIIDCRELTKDWIPEIPHSTLVGFENHSGKTTLRSEDKKQKTETKSLGTVIKGYGNNGVDRTEGAVYKNVFGTYLHGSLLPKNPWLADHLIKKALERRYKTEIKLSSLNDNFENLAHQAAINRAYTAKTIHI